MAKFQQTGASHPYAHKLRLRPSSTCSQTTLTQRALTVTNFHITPQTAFEMERPQTGAPKVVVINTSFRTAFLERRQRRKHVPTFPKLATDPPKSSVCRQSREQSGNPYRRLAASAQIQSARTAPQERSHSSRSDGRFSQQRTFLTPRQTNTFAAYAKYNEVVKSAKARGNERSAESPITSNINDLSALVPEKLERPQELLLSNEKQIWISDWIASTSAAMNLDNVKLESEKVTKPLAVIHEH